MSEQFTDAMPSPEDDRLVVNEEDLAPQRTEIKPDRLVVDIPVQESGAVVESPKDEFDKEPFSKVPNFPESQQEYIDQNKLGEEELDFRNRPEELDLTGKGALKNLEKPALPENKIVINESELPAETPRTVINESELPPQNPA